MKRTRYLPIARISIVLIWSSALGLRILDLIEGFKYGFGQYQNSPVSIAAIQNADLIDSGLSLLLICMAVFVFQRVPKAWACTIGAILTAKVVSMAANFAIHDFTLSGFISDNLWSFILPTVVTVFLILGRNEVLLNFKAPIPGIAP